MKFIYQFDKNSTKITAELPPDSSLPEVLEAFESFLKACGYCFTGEIDIVEEEPINHE